MKQEHKLYAVVNIFGSNMQIFRVVGITNEKTNYPIKIKNNELYVERDMNMKSVD